MATLESDKGGKALRGKMKAEREDSGDWYFYIKKVQSSNEQEHGSTLPPCSLKAFSDHFWAPLHRQTLPSNRSK